MHQPSLPSSGYLTVQRVFEPCLLRIDPHDHDVRLPIKSDLDTILSLEARFDKVVFEPRVPKDQKINGVVTGPEGPLRPPRQTGEDVEGGAYRSKHWVSCEHPFKPQVRHVAVPNLRLVQRGDLISQLLTFGRQREPFAQGSAPVQRVNAARVVPHDRRPAGESECLPGCLATAVERVMSRKQGEPCPVVRLDRPEVEFGSTDECPVSDQTRTEVSFETETRRTNRARDEASVPLSGKRPVKTYTARPVVHHSRPNPIPVDLMPTAVDAG